MIPKGVYTLLGIIVCPVDTSGGHAMIRRRV